MSDLTNMKSNEEMAKEKEKVTELSVIVEYPGGKPYYSIQYLPVGKKEYNIGYSSYELKFVCDWIYECFEIVTAVRNCPLEAAKEPEYCEFTKSNSTIYWYKTECGHYYKIASVQNDEFKFCPYCGRKIKVVEWVK